MRPVDPTRTPAGYIGGKRNLARRITALIETIPHRTYAEVFVGMGGIFLRRRFAAPAEVINDYSGDVANLFRILQRHYPQFMETLKFQLSGRREFERLKASDPATLTDLDRAGRFLYLQRLAFGGKVAGRNFGVDPAGTAGFNPITLAPQLDAIHQRLAAVTIENLRWQDFLTRYDRLGTLFYLDPPYYGSEGDYGPLFGREEFEEMAERLAHLKGRFVMSINDRPEVRALFSRFEMVGAETTYTIQAAKSQKAGELIIVGP